MSSPAQGNRVTVFRFRREDDGRVISPQHMWGTAEAIAALPGCVAMPETARLVHRKLIEEGFFFEQAPSVYLGIEEHETPG